MKIETRASMYCRQVVSVILGAALTSAPTLPAQTSQAAESTSLPDAPSAQTTAPATRKVNPGDAPTLLGTPKRIVVDEVRIVTSPARLRTHDLIWLLPVAGATAASLATDTKVSRDIVSHDPGFTSSANTSSDVLRGAFIGGPVVLYGVGQFMGNAKAREAGLLAGEAMVDGYITSEGIKYITLRERPTIQNARGHFFQTDSASDPSFVSGHSIVAWSSAAGPRQRVFEGLAADWHLYTRHRCKSYTRSGSGPLSNRRSARLSVRLVDRPICVQGASRSQPR